MINDCLILAGGYGTRLWPASSSRKPKQFLPTAKYGTESFFSLSLERAFRVIPENDGRVIVVMGKTHLPFVITACSGLSAAEKKRLMLIPEPEAKNTAPAIACAIEYAGKTGGWNRTMMVLTSDHIIKPLDAFLKDVSIAAQFAEQDRLVVFGISPLGPETGYGYIETAEKLTKDIYAAAAFREKPDRKTAEQFLASKKYFWNSGMFIFRCDFLAEEYRRLAADIISPFVKIKPPDKKSYTGIKDICVLDTWAGLDKAYNRTKHISFDYAIAEKCSKTVMIRASFDWIDIGNWDDYARLLSGNSAANSDNSKDVYTAGTRGCFVDSDIPVALAGVEDLIIVIRSGKDGFPPAVLITQKNKTQLVRDIVEKIKQTDNKDIL
jgi:mannose-1-phosphate guanylyltransferase/mannose-1-phosphate guanylyltransferase/mannose-6-phosphate isomerase